MSGKRERLIVGGGLLLVATAVWAAAFVHPMATGFGDWQMIHHNWEVGYVALTRYGEWPLWDPFHCGGVTMWGNPEAQHLSPFFFLSLLTGTTLAVKVMVVAHAWVGLVGMYLLARRHFDASEAAATFAALIWGCSGFFTWQIGGGHATFISFYLAPWVLLAWRAAVANWRMSVALAVVMSLVAWEGGTYPFPYFVLLLAFDAVVLLVRDRRPLKVAVAAALSGALTVLIAAVRWLPSMITLSRVGRNTNVPDSLAPWEILEMLTRRHFPWAHAGHRWVWPEYAAYIGLAAVVVCLAGIAPAIRRHRYDSLMGTVFFGALMSGQFAKWAPWTLIHHLPVYHSLRVPTRFAGLFILYLALLGAMSVDDWLPALTSSKPIRGLSAKWPKLRAASGWIVIAALVAPPIAYAIDRGPTWWPNPPIDTGPPSEHFHLVPGNDYGRIYASLPHRNEGTPACYVGNLNWPISKFLWLGNVPQARALDAAGTVIAFGRTVNTAWAEVRMSRAGTVVIDQNYDPGWRSNVGHVVEDRGRLAVELPAGEHRVRLVYRPASLGTSIGLTVAGILIALAIAFGKRARKLARRVRRPAGDPS